MKIAARFPQLCNLGTATFQMEKSPRPPSPTIRRHRRSRRVGRAIGGGIARNPSPLPLGPKQIAGQRSGIDLLHSRIPLFMNVSAAFGT